MKKVIVFYFHGYSSSPTTDKVARFKEHFPDTYAFPIDINPEISLPFLEDKIENTLLTYGNDCNTVVVFVGTSLGAWYAGELANVYPSAHCIMINPPEDPFYSLQTIGVDPVTAGYYIPTNLGIADKIFLATHDELFHYDEEKEMWDMMPAVTWADAGHRFNGPEFDLVIEYIKSLQ